MKKNISINISGIIFHIEEDGYGKLKDYLESINSYFSTYEDSKEIIADIESRIAEIFLSKLDDGKQVITLEDVDALVATMGTTADFEAVEDDVLMEETEKVEEEKATEETETQEEPVQKKLQRDERKRILGGVAAGMAHYFGIDALWIRLIMVLLFFNVFFGPISGFVFIAYIILWIVVPGSRDLEDDKEVKKMYRNPDSRVLGGVASGIAAYFGVDTTVIRLIFVLSIFLGGSGLLLYIILWIITPEANSITEKMQMQGEPVTLSNIEQNVKKSLNVKEGEENVFVKVLLFPFRIIAALFEALGKLLGPASKFLVEALRVLAGFAVTSLGLAGMVGLIICTSVVAGFASVWGDVQIYNDIPIFLIKNSFPTIGYIAAFVGALVPMLGVTLLGISILAKRWVLNATIGWTIFALWILSVIGIAFTVPKVVNDFSSEGEKRETVTYNFQDQVPTLAIAPMGMENYDMVDLKLRGHADSVFSLEKRFRSRGNSRQNALVNIDMVSYNVEQEGSNLYFDSNLSFSDDAVFRVQELEMILYIPFNQEFKMEHDLKAILRNTIHRGGYKTWQIEGNTWKFTPDDLVCVTCGDGRYREDERSEDGEAYGEEMIFQMEDFNQVEAEGNLIVEISQDKEYYVQVRGKERYMDDVYVKKVGDVLTIEMDEDSYDVFSPSEKKPVKVYVSMPELNSIKGSIATKFEVSDFDPKEFAIKLSGASSGEVDVDADNIVVRLKGGSRLDVSGDTRSLEAEISGGSDLRSYDLDAKTVNIDASGASSAKVYASNKIFAESSGMSSIRYKGGPEVTIVNKGKFSSVDNAE